MANFNLGHNEEAFMVLMEALGGTNKGGESYAYYMFDIKHAEPQESTRKLQIAIKVLFDGNRVKAKENIADALTSLIGSGKAGVTVVPHATKMQLDYVIREGQVIRVEIKPSSSKGSGGGAKGTTLQESAMCVYAAIRYTWGNGDLKCDLKRCKQVLNDDTYKEALKSCKIPKEVSLEKIKDMDKEWKDSLCVGANEIFDTIKAGDYIFERGGDIDKALGKAFSKVNKKPNGSTYFSNKNKWNPSDIWVYKKGKDTFITDKLSQKNITIDSLNTEIESLLDNKILMGISLKKSPGSSTMKQLNAGGPAGFAQRKRTNKTVFKGRKSKSMVIFDNGTKQVKKPDKKWPMDIYLYYGNGPQDRFQARNFGGQTDGQWQLELKGISANQGKIKGEVVRKVLEGAGFKGLPDEVPFSKCDSQKVTAKPNKITTDIYDLLNHFGATGLSKDKETDINLIKQRTRSYRFSKINGLNLLKWMEDHAKGNEDTSEASKAMKEIYLYASSQGDKASTYWKLS